MTLQSLKIGIKQISTRYIYIHIISLNTLIVLDTWGSIATHDMGDGIYFETTVCTVMANLYIQCYNTGLLRLGKEVSSH